MAKKQSNGEFKIEKGVPIPASKAIRGKYASIFKIMNIGDSVFFSGLSTNNVNSSADRILGAGGYAVRREGDGVRVWRIK